MCSKTRPIQPTILFGAFDRDNFGDLLFPHVAARLLDTENLLFAALAERDLCGAGGYRTRAISQLVKELGEHPVNILHVGGELLTCNAWQAAVMLQASEQVQSIIHRLEGDSDARNEWIRNQVGFAALAPYVLARELFRGTVWVIYTAVGGVELKERDEPFRTEVITKLEDADYDPRRTEVPPNWRLTVEPTRASPKRPAPNRSVEPERRRTAEPDRRVRVCRPCAAAAPSAASEPRQRCRYPSAFVGRIRPGMSISVDVR